MLINHLIILILGIQSVYMQSDTCDCNYNKKEYFYEDCAQVIGTTTINNGEEAALGQFPWQVLVGDDISGELCGGSLITHQHVMTAAHCVFGRSAEDMLLLVGHIDWQNAPSDDFSYIIEIKIYPSYTTKDAWMSAPDIAILTLEHSVSFSKRNFFKTIF